MALGFGSGVEIRDESGRGATRAIGDGNDVVDLGPRRQLEIGGLCEVIGEFLHRAVRDAQELREDPRLCEP
jgi:hypothetical protein